MKKVLFIFFLVGLVVFLGGQILAQGLEINYPDIPGGAPAPTDITTLPDYVRYIFNFSLIIAGLIAFGSLLYGGFRYLTSAGSVFAISIAKEQILAAFLGLVVLLSSYIILTTINPQLIAFPDIDLDSTTITPTSTLPQIQPKENFTFYQVPVGKIIERSLLNNTASIKIDVAKATAQDLENKARELRDLVGQLRDFTNSCICGTSQCSPIDPVSGVGCFPQGCPAARCNLARRDRIINDIETAIDELKIKQDNVANAQLSLAEDYSEIELAGLFMSLLSDEIEDYNTMLVDRHLIEEEGREMEFDYFLPIWEDTKVTFNRQVVNDPTTFYFSKAGNEDTIMDAQTFVPINFPAPGVFAQSFQPFDPTPPSVETTTGIIDFQQDYYQNIGAWRNQIIDNCPNRPDNEMWYSGCGLTSLATVIFYLTPTSTINPGDIARKVNVDPYRNSFSCSSGSIMGNQSKIATEYNISPSGFYSFNQAVNELKKGNPVITSCGNFINRGYAHIIVLKGIKDGYIWIHDPAGYFVKYHNGKLSPSTYSQWNCGRYYISFEKQP